MNKDTNKAKIERILDKNMMRLTPEAVIQHIMEHGASEEWDSSEGIVQHRVHRYKHFVMLDLPIDLVDEEDRNTKSYSQLLANDYADMPADEAPAIILETDGTIIDGFHRVQAALLRKDKTIHAYVGQYAIANLDSYEEF